MRILVTGASGWIGSAVVPQLHDAGHEVIGLARSPESAAAIEAVGAQARPGSLEDLASLRSAAEESDGVIHLAFLHDFLDYANAVRVDMAAIATFGDVLAGTDRPLVIASGTLGLAHGQVATEHDGTAVDPGAAGAGRALSARATLDLADRGVRSCVLRLPPTVHGDGDKGFIARLIGIDRAQGSAAYVGDGANRWPAVHRHDAATLFRLAVESAPAGSVLHATDDEGVPLRAVAEVIAQRLTLPLRSVPQDQAAEHFGWLGPMLAADAPASSALTRQLLGWEPAGPGLIEDLEQGHYFRT